MNKLKYILLMTFLLFTILQSCKIVEEDSIITDETSVVESTTLRIVLNEIITSHIDSTATKNNKLRSLCFQFNYPIELSYNDNVVVEVLDFNGIIDIVENETCSMYITGIKMPFVVTQDSGHKLTVNNESDFFSLIESCSTIVLPVEDDFIEDCFQFSYPIQTKTTDGTVYTITSASSFADFTENHWSDWMFEFVYPFEIVLESGELSLINSDYELFDILYNCIDIGCDCDETDSYPVCVLLEDATTIEFSSSCEAICNGFTESDFVSCDDPSETIYNFELVVGSCNDNWTYDVSIDFDYTSSSSENFILFANNEYLGTFPLDSLPLNFEFPVSEYYYELLEIYLDDESSDTSGFFTTWIAETCDGLTSDYVDQLGVCYDFSYPIDIYYNDFITTVYSRTELLNYYYDETGTTALSFPLGVINTSTSELTIAYSMYGLENYINENCE